MSLFTELLRLHAQPRPTENFFSQLAAAVLRRRTALAVEWLTGIGIEGLDGFEVIEVTSEVPLTATDSLGGSRIDLWIKLEGGEPRRRVVVAIESKLGSEEGPGQLETYLGHLERLPSDVSRWLVYVTRDLDPKSLPGHEAQDGSTSPVRLLQARWSSLYPLLERHRDDDLVQEVMTFMKEQRMDGVERIGAVDLVAMEGLPRAFAFMSEALARALQQASETDSDGPLRLPGKVSVSWADVRERDRFVVIHEFRPKVTLLFGFFFGSEGDAPRLEVNIQAAPSVPNQSALRSAFATPPQNEGWVPYNLEGPSEWIGIRTRTPVISQLGDEPHLQTVAGWFANRIGEARAWAETVPALGGRSDG